MHANSCIDYIINIIILIMLLFSHLAMSDAEEYCFLITNNLINSTHNKLINTLTEVIRGNYFHAGNKKNLLLFKRQ